MLQPGPVQSNYNRYILAGQVGILADMINFDADTRQVETAAGIGFGLAVSQGTNANGCIIGGTAFCGITRSDPNLPASTLVTVDKYSQYDNASVVVKGDIWVAPSGTGTIHPGDAVYYNTSTGALGFSGGTVIEDARWMTALQSGKDATGNTVNVAVVRLGNIAGNR
jgi:hypothetical protein